MQQLSIENIVKIALAEDIGNGDITSNLTIDNNIDKYFEVRAKQDFVLAGIDYFIESMNQISKNINITYHKKDGDFIKDKEVFIKGNGDVKSILIAERVALNFVQYLSGISTEVHKYVNLVKGFNISILDTRKTIPLYRQASKYAVRLGGGKNHRIRLDDQILIKDNHIAASGDINLAIRKCRKSNLIIEVECETFEQVKNACIENPDIIMLDNMQVNDLKTSITYIRKNNKNIKIEVSGNICENTIIEIAQTGPDYISIGKITHSSNFIDISMKIL